MFAYLIGGKKGVYNTLTLVRRKRENRRFKGLGSGFIYKIYLALR